MMPNPYGKNTMEMTMSKPQYRSKIGIISEILDVTMDAGSGGAIVSLLARRTNLSHYALIENCQKLIDAGMVTSTNNDKNHIFIVTEKGMQFFQELQKFIEIAKSIKVRF